MQARRKIRVWSSVIALAAGAASAAIAQDAPSADVPAIIAKMHKAAVARGLPPEIAEAVGFVETGFDPSRIGAAGEVGVMQVMPPTAAQLGFAGTNAELADVDTNIRYGVEYLAAAWSLAGHDLCRTLNKYRAGHGSESMSPASASYCQRARAYLASIHSPLGEGAVATLDDVVGTRPRSAPLRDGPGFWKREQARVRMLDAKVKARWALIAAHNARVDAGRRSLARTAELTSE